MTSEHGGYVETVLTHDDDDVNDFDNYVHHWLIDWDWATCRYELDARQILRPTSTFMDKSQTLDSLNYMVAQK